MTDEICAWCEKVLRGELSSFHGLCYKCRISPEGKQHIKEFEE